MAGKVSPVPQGATAVVTDEGWPLGLLCPHPQAKCLPVPVGPDEVNGQARLASQPFEADVAGKGGRSGLPSPVNGAKVNGKVRGCSERSLALVAGGLFGQQGVLGNEVVGHAGHVISAKGESADVAREKGGREALARLTGPQMPDLPVVGQARQPIPERGPSAVVALLPEPASLAGESHLGLPVTKDLAFAGRVGTVVAVASRQEALLGWGMGR